MTAVESIIASVIDLVCRHYEKIERERLEFMYPTPKWLNENDMRRFIDLRPKLSDILAGIDVDSGQPAA